MGIIEIYLIAISLAMDACAVSLCKGMAMKKVNIKHYTLIALCFGLFQAAMPLIGWSVGIQFQGYISQIDHWVAFVLLSIIGIKMLHEAFSSDDETPDYKGFNIKETLILGVATSIDALAVGVSFAVLDDVDITLSAVIIGITAFVFSFIGLFTGQKFGAKLGKFAEILGGIALIGIAVKILVEHLFFS